MASVSENGIMGRDNFQEFFISWKDEQNHYLHDLITASRASTPVALTDPSLCGLVDRAVAHYEEYYKTKTKWAKKDVLLLLSPPWNTPLEDAFLWVGGWRPTTAFHLLYSKSGLQFEANLSDLVKGVKTGDLGDLSSDQLGLIDQLQRITIQEERKITEKVAKHQERVADMEMVELSHDLSESTRIEGESDEAGRVDSILKPKEEGFQMILQSADDLRMRTIKAVVNILSPIQAVHFLIAAAELQLRLHDWGKEKEEKQANNINIQAAS
ncbi:hypothetical protein DH2020_035167 [Rehmannia glutinosa]|uniref:DOG1 domain-containing protein n=1 Tax=Rehmannia glutinosa TaxID=99300 RepID=A0ABR0V7Z1_REHGL